MSLAAGLRAASIKKLAFSAGLLVLQPLIFPASLSPAKASTPGAASYKSSLVGRARKDLLNVKGLEDLSESDRDVAEQLEIWPMLQELYDKNKIPSAERKAILLLKIRETIFEAYFDAASIMSESQREVSILVALRESVVAKRDRGVDVNNASNFITSGTLNTIGSVLGFSADTPPFSGNLNQMLSGVVSMGMSTYALKQANGGKTRGQGKPTVVAELFGRPFDDRTKYPETVWRFLHGKSMDDPSKSRAEVLEQKWIALDHMDRPGSKRAEQKLDLICGKLSEKKQMTIDDLNDQIAIIADISEMTSRLIKHLRNLISVTDSDLSEAEN